MRAGANRSSDSTPSRLVTVLSVACLLLASVAVQEQQAAAASAGSRLWVSGPEGLGGIQGVASPDGSMVFVSGGIHDVTALNAATGEVVWPGDVEGYGRAAAVSPDGATVFVVGTANSNSNILVAAFDASTGASRWVKYYDGPVDAGYDVGIDIGVSPSGRRVYVTGSSDSKGSPQDFVTLAYRAEDGTRQWAKRYAGPGGGGDNPSGLTVSPDGSSVFVTGQAFFDDVTGFDYITIAYDAATGARLWKRRFGGTLTTFDYDGARVIGATADGSRVLVSGMVQLDDAGTRYAIGTVAYNATSGRQVWSRLNGGVVRDDAPNSLATSPSGSQVFVTGARGGDVVTLAYSVADGAKLFIKSFDGYGSDSEAGNDVVVSPDGATVFVAGLVCSDPAPDCDAGAGLEYGTFAYSTATGQRLWLRRYSDPTNWGQATSVAVSPDGTSIFVVGASGTVAYATQ
jgi:DNA-binding beta-propeller fold protein YncE